MRRLAVLLALALARPALAGEAYYALVFSGQRIPNDPDHSHTFATFVKVTWQGDGPMAPPARFEAVTISWLPANLVVRTRALQAERGNNFGLHETLRWALADGQRVSLWGPFPACPDLYRRAMARAAHLGSGTVRYKANDLLRDSDRVSNCIHGVSQAISPQPLTVFIPGWGEVASYAVFLRMRRLLIDEMPQTWLVGSLGLHAYPIIYRGNRAPRSGALLGPLYRLLGGERGLQATFGAPF
ncbi:MAG: hypothetical protein K2W96_21910 [Gemmataceae bacterium]|nr:hypothetical protein [Gemmataceae bacterium]